MRYALILVLLVTGVASCDSTKPTNPLAEREAVALLREISRLMVGIGTVACSIGGEATVTETGDQGEDGDSLWAHIRWTVTLTDCEANVVNDTLTLNGEPNVQLTSDSWVVFDDDYEVVKAEARLVVGGAMTWRRRNGDADTCSVDLTFESTEFDNDEGFTGDFKGRMCGFDLVVNISELF